ncbi:MAG: Phosphatidylglycerol/phosphatidylinositol transfer protein [Thelocarpon superellum]|nr:MAG: Phosphatidylglycerol/phosphatidylinositol transfer protein [Thelocarpon superellum]
MAFAFGGNGSFLFNVPAVWSYKNLPQTMTVLLAENKIKDVYSATLGKDASVYHFACLSEEGPFQIHVGLPAALAEWLEEPSRTICRVTLGPGGSFFAWDDHSFRWHNVPAGLEKHIQSWMGPQVWTLGSPRWVALGANGAFIALSAKGSAARALSKSYPTLNSQLEEWVGDADPTHTWSELKYVFLDPFRPDHFFAVTNAGDYWAAHKEEIVNTINIVATAIHDPARANRLAEAVEKRKLSAVKELREEAQRARHAKAKAQEEQKRRQQAEQGKQHEAARRKMRAETMALTLYPLWRAQCTAALQTMTTLPGFPHPPIAVCVCDEMACALRKSGPDDLKACKHDLEILLRVDSAYSLAWLRKQRNDWHSDRWARAPVGTRAELMRKADQMFKLYGELMAGIREG